MDLELIAETVVVEFFSVTCFCAIPAMTANHAQPVIKSCFGSIASGFEVNEIGPIKFTIFFAGGKIDFIKQW